MNTRDHQVTLEGLGLKETESHVCEAELKPAEICHVLSNEKKRSTKNDCKKTILIKPLSPYETGP
jgi:hypothetical protein